MRSAVLVLALLFLTACESDKTPAGKPAPGAPAGAAKEAPAAAAAAAPDSKGRDPFVHCLDLIREKRYPEALTVCREAEKSNPNDPQIKRAIDIAESGGES